MSHLLETSTTTSARPVLRVRHAPYHIFVRVDLIWAVDLAKESWPLYVAMIHIVSEVPSPEGKGIRLLLKMFLPLYSSLLN